MSTGTVLIDTFSMLGLVERGVRDAEGAGRWWHPLSTDRAKRERRFKSCRPDWYDSESSDLCGLSGFFYQDKRYFYCLPCRKSLFQYHFRLFHIQSCIVITFCRRRTVSQKAVRRVISHYQELLVTFVIPLRRKL